MQTIGFIGIGTMGRGMVQNLAKNGFKVLAYNRTREKVKDLASAKVKILERLEDAASADVIIMCLSDDYSLQDILFVKRFLSKIPKGKVLIDSSTTSIEMTEKVAKECAKIGVDFLDAPVTGSKLGASGGTLTYMVGGKKEVFDKCLHILNAMGKVIVYCGPSTYGQRAKISLNMTMSLIMESYFEGIIFALKNNVPLEAIETIFENSGVKSAAGSFKMQYVKKRDFSQHFMLKLMVKDLRLAKKERERLGLKLPLSDKILEVFEKSISRGDEDVSTIVKELEKQAGLEIRG